MFLGLARLVLASFQFFKPPSEQTFATLAPVYELACSLTRQLNDLEKSMHVDLYGTFYVYQGTVLTACCLLRLLKTPFADSIDSQTGQALFFSAITMLRNISLDENDKPARSAKALQNLWRSEKVFKTPAGDWNLELRVKSRFGPSVVYDTMWSVSLGCSP